MNPDDVKRIQENVAMMRAKGAPESDVLAYLRTESQREQTGTAPAATSSAPPVAMGTGLVSSALRGATLGWGDKMGAKISDLLMAIHADKLNPEITKLGFAPIVPGDQVLARDAAINQGFHQQHPVADVAAQMAGAIASPVNKILPGVGEGTSVGGVAARGALAGGLLGAANGAGEAQDGHRLAGAAVGGLFGAAGGALIPGAVAAGKTMLDPMRPAMSQLAGALDVPAARETAARMAALGKGGITTVADLSPQARALADHAATVNPDAAASINMLAAGRQSDQAERVLQNVRSGLGGDEPSVAARMEDLVASRRQWAAGPSGFQGLRDMNIKVPPAELATLNPILKQPVVRSALKQAMDTGLIGTEPPSSFQALQDVKESLDDAITRAYKNGEGNLGARLGQARDVVKNFLIDHVPDYSSVNAEYQSRLGLEDALEAGAQAWGKNDVQGLSRQIAKLSPAELEQFRSGMAAKLIEQLSSASTNRDVASSLTNAGRAEQQKLQTVFGDEDTFDHFMQQMKAEQDMAKLRGAGAGSQTASRLAASGTSPAGAVGLGYAALHNPAALPAYLALVAGKQAAQRNVSAQAGKLAPLLMTQGHDAISALLDQLEQGAGRPLAGPIAGAAPAVAARAGGLLSAQ